MHNLDFVADFDNLSVFDYLHGSESESIYKRKLAGPLHQIRDCCPFGHNKNNATKICIASPITHACNLKKERRGF
jgi:hypothetical protein